MERKGEKKSIHQIWFQVRQNSEWPMCGNADDDDAKMRHGKKLC